MNAHSSRSHSIFTITIEQTLVAPIAITNQPHQHKKTTIANKHEHIKAKFHLVDLAVSTYIYTYIHKHYIFDFHFISSPVPFSNHDTSL